jgi:uncharacterized small protein (DUF1192 family)
MSEERKIDPVHFFNSCGLSAYSESYYLERIKELNDEVERLNRLLRRKSAREASAEIAN